MKKTSFLTAALLSTAIMPAFVQSRAASSTFEGVISDAMCGKRHMMPGKSDADCPGECVKANASYALVTANKVYKLSGNAREIASLAGKHVWLSGDVRGTTIAVASIHQVK